MCLLSVFFSLLNPFTIFTQHPPHPNFLLLWQLSDTDKKCVNIVFVMELTYLTCKFYQYILWACTVLAHSNQLQKFWTFKVQDHIAPYLKCILIIVMYSTIVYYWIIKIWKYQMSSLNCENTKNTGLTFPESFHKRKLYFLYFVVVLIDAH